MKIKLLSIVPHFQVFIRDQTIPLLHSIEELNIMIPIPYFSKMITKIPHIKKQFQFLKMANDSISIKSARYKIFKSRFFTLPFGFIRNRNPFLAARSCISTLNNLKPSYNLIHSHFISEGYVGARIKSKFKRPLIVTAHGRAVYEKSFRNYWHSRITKYTLNVSDHIIAVSKFISNKIRLLGCPSEKISVIPNGFNPEKFLQKDIQSTRTKLRLPHDKKILLSVGNLIPIKGHKYLIDAMRLVIEKQSDVLLLIIGTGNLREQLQRKIIQLGLKKNIQFLGSKEHSSIPDWMNACDVLVLPSLGEGFPTVIPEAMACGKPVIASRVGGIPEIVQNDRLGRLTEPRNFSELANAILDGIAEKWNSHYISKFAKQFSWSSLSQKILEIYKRIIAENGV